jgi:hypothetical protein
MCFRVLHFSVCLHSSELLQLIKYVRVVIIIYYYYYFLWLSSPARAMGSSFTRFRDHAQRLATIVRIPPDE